jgi:hypothetical protein
VSLPVTPSSFRSMPTAACAEHDGFVKLKGWERTQRICEIGW